MNLREYLNKVSKELKTKVAKELSYRGFLKDYLEALDSSISAISEAKKQTDIGKPDYLILKNKIKIGYIETKDIDADLDKDEKNEQMDRYLGLDNLILTNYLEFRFYRNGEKVSALKLASVEGEKDKKIKINNATFEEFEQAIKNFLTFAGTPIESSKKLAPLMALKARGIKNKIENDLNKEQSKDDPLRSQLDGFRKVLIHDLSEQAFADMYAQTIAYGLFIARLHDDTPENFSRKEARELIPKTNPFLRKFFEHISGTELDERIAWMVDDLAEMCRYVDVEKIKDEFEKSKTGKDDPFLHFYEDFLTEYDKKIKNARGAYYTPKAVVDFIVRAVDDILQTEFGLPRGLADTSKVKKKQGEFDRVQILDPATGTGTFLAETINHIRKKFAGQEGMWDDFINNNLIPRLHGFEILMAPYTMAYLKLELLLQETMQKKNINQRLKVYLTNALEENEGKEKKDEDQFHLAFARWLSDESNEANKVKRDMPIMCVLGNPPYSVSSSNKSRWIEDLREDYKKDLKEKNIQPLADDYIKFIRCGQHFIDKNGEGILAYISNNSFIDGVIHRQMRKHLLESFDKIYILDLHGNVKKKETAKDGSVDQNVFDIQQGVSINIFVKTGKKNKGELGGVLHHDLQGRREEKYEYLLKKSLKTTPFKKLPSVAPHYYFVPKDFSAQKKYDEGFGVNKLFKDYNAGFVTARDDLVIQFSKEEVKRTIKEFTELDVEEARRKFNLPKDSSDWTIEKAQRDLLEHKLNEENIVKTDYRPFDWRYMFYTKKSKGFLSRPRYDVMRHMMKDNIGVCIPNQSKQKGIESLVTKNVSCKHLITGETYHFPLYTYPEDSAEEDDRYFTEAAEQKDQTRKPNFDEKIIQEIASRLKLPFVPEKKKEKGGKAEKNSFAPIDVLDYIYAVLHCPSYREKYKEFLKIDFPKVPYPTDQKSFWTLVALGEKLREVHLLESTVVENFITQFPISGDNIVLRERVKYIAKKAGDGKAGGGEVGEEIGTVMINETQSFDNVPKVAWCFTIGGYQPAQKWLKERNGRCLSHQDVAHYQKMIVALAQTDRLMKEIDAVLKV